VPGVDDRRRFRPWRDRAWTALVVALATLGAVLLVSPVGDTFFAQDAAYVTTNDEAWAWPER